ncbi:aminodeoxychorismate synthase component I [Heyndrickxia sporothermodurans]
MTTNEYIMNDPYLLFEFAQHDGSINPLLFKNPEKIITTSRIDEVISCMEEIQEQVSKGYYAAGYLSYEAAPAFDPAFQVCSCEKMPLLWFGIFSQPIIHKETERKKSFKVSEWEPTIHGHDYHTGIEKIKSAIENGDTYQINYTTRLKANFEGDDFSFYQHLTSVQESNYCAYLNIGDFRILSASPELFFRWDGNKIITRPMKGTIHRGKTVEEDENNANWLFHSEKNRAENVMIVDLLRNDLGNIAIPGTVKVEELFKVEQYPTVWQMTSSISAKTEKNIDIVDIFSALFPCGSITGAPKISTMKYIANLEDSPREVYCGAIGYISPKGETIFNVPIRTVMIDQQVGEAVYGVGGGITWDSTATDEYEEIVTKAKLLTANRPSFQLLESLLLENNQYFLLDQHLNRLKKSAEFFNFTLPMNDIYKELNDIASKHSKHKMKIRLLVSKNGEFTIGAETISKFNQIYKVKISDKPINKNNRFHYHKTTNRQCYQEHKVNQTDVFDVILWNQDGELTEFINGNIVLEIDGMMYTPKQSAGLLAGTFRSELIQSGKIKERVLKVQDLQLANKIWFINSVRKWVEVIL